MCANSKFIWIPYSNEICQWDFAFCREVPLEKYFTYQNIINESHSRLTVSFQYLNYVFVSELIFCNNDILEINGRKKFVNWIIVTIHFETNKKFHPASQHIFVQWKTYIWCMFVFERSICLFLLARYLVTIIVPATHSHTVRNLVHPRRGLCPPEKAVKTRHWLSLYEATGTTRTSLNVMK